MGAVLRLGIVVYLAAWLPGRAVGGAFGAVEPTFLETARALVRCTALGLAVAWLPTFGLAMALVALPVRANAPISAKIVSFFFFCFLLSGLGVGAVVIIRSHSVFLLRFPSRASYPPTSF